MELPFLTTFIRLHDAHCVDYSALNAQYFARTTPLAKRHIVHP
ncbi:hypothetical protein [Vibrio neptunius]|nr:hypothetical protein [Vibrio neptunius]